MATIVSGRLIGALICLLMMATPGEVLEKTTRVLTDEEKALLETEFVGNNGSKRKLEVTAPPSSSVANGI
jgi:hypothetical protein